MKLFVKAVPAVAALVTGLIFAVGYFADDTVLAPLVLARIFLTFTIGLSAILYAHVRMKTVEIRHPVVAWIVRAGVMATVIGLASFTGGIGGGETPTRFFVRFGTFVVLGALVGLTADDAPEQEPDDLIAS